MQPKTQVLCLRSHPAQTTTKCRHPPGFKIPPNLRKRHLPPEITRTPKPGLNQTAPIPAQCLPFLQPHPLVGNSSVLGRRTVKSPKLGGRRRRWRRRGGRLSHRWSPAVRRIIRLRMMTVKTAPCLLPPPAHGRLASGSQLTVKCCGDWLKIHHQPKFCGSSRAG